MGKIIYITFKDEEKPENEFSELFIERYCVTQEEYKWDVRNYLSSLRQAIIDENWNITILSYIPKENIEIVKECLRVDTGSIESSKHSIAIKFGVKNDRIDAIMQDFQLTLINDIHKRLWLKKNYGKKFGSISDLTDEKGICDLGLPSSAYITLKSCHINTMEDLTSISIYQLLKIHNIGSVIFSQILESVHRNGEKFPDEESVKDESFICGDYVKFARDYLNRNDKLSRRNK